MKLITTILTLFIIYTADVKASAINPGYDGYNYERPEQAFEQQELAEQSNPVESVAQEEINTVSVNELAVDNTVNAEAENQQLVADEEPAPVIEDSDISTQSVNEVQAPSIDEDVVESNVENDISQLAPSNVISNCGENARDWMQVVFDRSQVHPNNRRITAYAEDMAEQSYFD